MQHKFNLGYEPFNINLPSCRLFETRLFNVGGRKGRVAGTKVFPDQHWRAAFRTIGASLMLAVWQVNYERGGSLFLPCFLFFAQPFWLAV